MESFSVFCTTSKVITSFTFILMPVLLVTFFTSAPLGVFTKSSCAFTFRPIAASKANIKAVFFIYITTKYPRQAGGVNSQLFSCGFYRLQLCLRRDQYLRSWLRCVGVRFGDIYHFNIKNKRRIWRNNSITLLTISLF